MAAELTINEVAHIAEVSTHSVEKAIEVGIMKPVRRRTKLSKVPVRHLGLDAVCYFAVVGHSAFLKEVPVKCKKKLLSAIRDVGIPESLPPGSERDLPPIDLILETVDLEPGLHLDLEKIAGPKLNAALTYTDGKRRYISSDLDIFGDVPKIKGTRIPVYAIRDRLADNDTFEDLL